MSIAVEQQLPAATWSVDPVHSTIGFSIKYLVSKFRTEFERYDATLDTAGDEPRLVGTVDPTSIRVKDENFHAHLQSPDFFDSERHPAAALRVDRVPRRGRRARRRRRADDQGRDASRRGPRHR